MKSFLTALVLFASVSHAQANSRLKCESDPSESGKRITVVIDQYIYDPVHGTLNRAIVQNFNEAPVVFSDLIYYTKNNFGGVSHGFILGSEFALSQPKKEGPNSEWNLRVPSMNIHDELMICKASSRI